MAATLDHLYASARCLPVMDQGALVSLLLADLSGRLPESDDSEMEAIANQREAEMDADASSVVSHDDMLKFIESRRR